MKKVLFTIMMVGTLALTACGKAEETTKTETTAEVYFNTDVKEDLLELADGATDQETESNTVTEQTNNAYVGEYLDYENNEPNLFINANGDGTYKVEIGIFRLAVFEDLDAVITDAGLEFECEDGAGNPIKGVITLEGNEAVVTFTDSTWELIPNGTVYRYHKPETK